MLSENPSPPFTKKGGQLPQGHTASCCKWNWNLVLSAPNVLLHLKCPLKSADRICMTNNNRKLWWCPLCLPSSRHLGLEWCWEGTGIMKLKLSEYTFSSLLPGRPWGEIYQQKHKFFKVPQTSVPVRNYEPLWVIRIAFGHLWSAKVLIQNGTVIGQMSQRPGNDKVTKKMIDSHWRSSQIPYLGNLEVP